MRYTVYAILLFIALVAGGCAETINFNDPVALSSAIKVKYSKQDETTDYAGPEYTQDDKKVSLSANRNDRIGITNYLITIDTIYFGDMRNYYNANDANGNKFDFKPNFKRKDSCDNSGCWQEENFGLITSREYLQVNQEKGLLIKASGISGVYQTFTVPATYIKAFLSVVKKP